MNWTYLLFIAPLLVGTFQHSERTKRIASAWRRALQAHGIGTCLAAQIQDIDESQCRKQLDADGTNPGLYRAGQFPDAVQIDFLKLWGAELGLLVLDSHDSRDLLLEQAIRSAKRTAVAKLPGRRKGRKEGAA